MSPLRDHDNLDALETEIDSLETTMIDAQRRAGDLIGDELSTQIAEAEATIAKLRLDMRYRQYFKVARAARVRKTCPIHGADALVVSCPDCCKAWGYVPGDSSETSLVHDLAGTRAAVAVGDAHGVEPRTTLRILEASRRSA